MSGNYDSRPETEVLTFPAQIFGAASKSFNYVGPAGRRGVVLDIVADITADMAGATTVPEIDVGTTAGDASYAQFRLGTAAGAGYTAAQGVRRASQIVRTLGQPQSTGVPTASDFAGHVALETAFIPKDTPFVVTLKAGTGGAPSGTAHVYVHIKWF
jgi:hypothetical protein